MKSINFSTGIREYKINEDESRVIRINLSDLNMGSRIEEMKEKINALDQKYGSIKKPTSKQLAEMDSSIRSIIDYAFGTDVCTPAFGEVNVMSPVEGTPLFRKFFEAFLPALKADVNAMKIKKPEIRPEVQKYLEKPQISSVQPIAALAQPCSQPAGIDISSLTKEQKTALLAQLIS
ncbi:MAG: hypothetical protein IJX77_09620 [Ruminococcus sp.]|nr:hypothetical protein [Ruminococcus sp.]